MTTRKYTELEDLLKEYKEAAGKQAELYDLVRNSRINSLRLFDWTLHLTLSRGGNEDQPYRTEIIVPLQNDIKILALKRYDEGLKKSIDFLVGELNILHNHPPAIDWEKFGKI